jgi:hypothetical protein
MGSIDTFQPAEDFQPSFAFVAVVVVADSDNPDDEKNCAKK